MPPFESKRLHLMVCAWTCCTTLSNPIAYRQTTLCVEYQATAPQVVCKFASALCGAGARAFRRKGYSGTTALLDERR